MESTRPPYSVSFAMSHSDLLLDAADLRRDCDPAALGFSSTEEVAPLEGAIGQPRALAAIAFGLEIETSGYNIYASGPIGTGKRSTVEAHLTETAADRPTPGDWVYLFNFTEPDRPIAVVLPTARGRELAARMDRFVDDAKREIRSALESEDYARSQRELREEVVAKREQPLEELQRYAEERGFALKQTPAGVVTSPLIDGHPATEEEFERLPQPDQDRFRAAGEEIQGRMHEFITSMRALERDAHERLRRLDRDVALYAVGHLVDDVKAEFADCDEVVRWLGQVPEDIVENVDQFRPGDGGGGGEEELPAPISTALRRSRGEFFGRYAVNVLVSHDEGAGAPVIVEANPTYYNLFGRIDYQATFGAVGTDHRYIRAGAVHRANGGYLLLQAADVLTRAFAWDKLKEVLRTGRLQPENMGAQYTLFPTAMLSPEPTDLRLKVILVGPARLYELLYLLDEDFRKLFKVKADFDVEMPWADEAIGQYAAFISRQVRADGLLDFDAAAVARVVEFGARDAGDRRRLSTSFLDIANLVAEASHWARLAGSPVTSAEHVQRAIEQKAYRSNLIEEKVRRLIDDGTLLVDLTGATVGQVNGLAAIAIGDYEFGRPVRITATTAAGHGDVLAIDRETELSGPIHDKGFLILSGFLQDHFARERPLSLSASLTFEQSYDEVEGDSASSAELYALLSSLADAPLDQGIAVTGSVNQKGQVQAIGAVNEKAEGFFEVCRQRGLTGKQGVLIPRSNVPHLMLKEEVVQAVRDGQFNVWAVATVDQGIELLTGVPAGRRDSAGAYPAGSLNRRIADRLLDLAESVREYAARPDGAVGHTSPAKRS
jgi:predicted ATP-dependent protease